VCIRVHPPEIKYTKRSAIGCIFQCSFTGNEIYKTKLPLFASKEKHVGKKHYLFLHKDFDRSKKLSQFTFNLINRQNFFFLANTLMLWEYYQLITAIADQCQAKKYLKKIIWHSYPNFFRKIMKPEPHIFVMFKIDQKNADQLEMLYR
jgi:hypothetical protein